MTCAGSDGRIWSNGPSLPSLREHATDTRAIVDGPSAQRWPRFARRPTPHAERMCAQLTPYAAVLGTHQPPHRRHSSSTAAAAAPWQAALLDSAHSNTNGRAAMPPPQAFVTSRNAAAKISKAAAATRKRAGAPVAHSPPLSLLLSVNEVDANAVRHADHVQVSLRTSQPSRYAQNTRRSTAFFSFQHPHLIAVRSAINGSAPDALDDTLNELTTPLAPLNRRHPQRRQHRAQQHTRGKLTAALDTPQQDNR